MAKFIALSRTCQLAKEQSTTMHIKMGYTFGVVLDFGMFLKQRSSYLCWNPYQKWTMS